MSASPWMKFYPRDWRGDQALRAVSLAARGLWIDCLCIMHEAQPYGHLVLGSQPVTDVVLARMTGTTPDQISELLGELESAAVFARRSDGTIYSRRMTRDFKGEPDFRRSSEWSEIRMRVFVRDDFTCAYCGVRGERMECDHIVPVSRGGSHDDENLTTACKPCNQSKRDKLLSEWLS